MPAPSVSPAPSKILSLPTAPAPKPAKPRRSKRADGLYQVECRYTEDGVTRRKSFYGKTQAEAQAKRKAFQSELERGVSAKAMGVTVSEWVDKWLAMRAQLDANRATPSTYNTYKREAQRLLDAVGHKLLREIVKSDIQMILNSRAGMSKKAIRATRNTLKQIFRAAVDDRVIPTSPCDGITTPEGTEGTHRALSTSERALITSTWQGHRMGLFALLMLYAGLRRGEVAALTWEDIGTNIRIRESVAYAVNGPIRKTPKTEAGIRTVPIVKPLADALATVTDRAGYVCTSASGRQLTQSACERGWESYLYHLAVEMNGCHYRWADEKGSGKANWVRCDIRMHDLRHTYCTMIYDAGVDIKRAQRLMGHASLDMTMRIYTHLSEEKERSSDAALHRYFASAGKNAGKPKRYRLKTVGT